MMRVWLLKDDGQDVRAVGVNELLERLNILKQYTGNVFELLYMLELELSQLAVQELKEPEQKNEAKK